MTFIQKLKLCLRILKKAPSGLFRHAERELPAPGDDDMQFSMNLCLKEMILVFSTQGHSGFSASYAVSALTKLLKYEPLGPITGADSEWMEVGEDLWQNTRCSHVFKDSSGAYDIDGKIFREPNGATYTSRESRVPVVFPYTPKREYVDVPA